MRLRPGFLTMAASAWIWPALAMADPLRGGGGNGGIAPWLPEALRPVAAWLLVTQRHLIGDLQQQMALVRAGGEPAAMVAIIAAAALYGVLHAAGPGHGKVVVASYFASRHARLLHALRLSVTISAVQAASAIILVSVMAGLLDLGGRTLLAGTALFETVSFGLIAVFGVVLAWRALRGGDDGCCGHSHDHHHDDACGHHHHGDKAARRELLFGGLAVGLRPCTGAVLILLFTFANGLYGLGIAATLAMAAGSAVTVAVVGAGAIGARGLSKLGGPRGPAWAGRAIKVAAGLIIALSGGAMMAVSLLIGPVG